MNFREEAARLVVAPEEAVVFNQRHRLSVVLGEHVVAASAETHLEHVPDHSLVFVEKTVYDASRIDDTPTDLMTIDPRAHRAVRSASAAFVDNMPYAGPRLLRMKDDEPSKYQAYREQIIEVATDPTKRSEEFGMDMFAGYKASLYFGLVDKYCYITPGDASTAQLPMDVYMANHSVTNMLMPRQLLDLTIPSEAIYDHIVGTAARYHDMSRYRDFAVVRNMVDFDDTTFRAIQGVQPDAMVQTAVIRGHGHRESFTGILDTAGILYTSTSEADPAGQMIRASFSPNQTTLEWTATEIERALSTIQAKSDQSSLDAELAARLQASLPGLASIAIGSKETFTEVRDTLLRISSFNPNALGRFKARAERRSLHKAAYALITHATQ